MRYFLRPGTIQSYNHAGDTAPASTSESSSFEAPNYEEHGYLRSPAISTTLGSTSRLPNKSPALPNTPTLTGTANRRTLAHYQSAIRLKANVEKSLKEARATMQFWRRKAREDMDFIMTPSTSKASSVGSDSADAQDHLTPARRAAVEALLARYRAQTEARSSHSSPDEDSESFSDDLTLDSIRFVAGATSDELASIFTSETAVSGALSAICDLLSIDGVIQSDEEEHTSRTPSPTRSGSSGTTISACEPASRIPLSTRSRGYSLGSVNSSTPIKGTATATPTRTGNQEAGRSKLASPPRSRSIAASRTYRQSEDFTPIPDTPSPASRASTLPSVPALTSTPPRQAPASRLRRPTVSSALKAVDSPAPAQNFSGTANSPQVRTRKSSLSTGTGFLPRAAYAASSLPTRSHVQAPLSPIRFADAPSPPRAVSSLSARPTVSFSGRRSSTSLSSRPATSLDKPVPSTSCSPGPSITNKPVLTTPSKPPPSTPNRPASSLNGRSRAPSFGAAAPPRPHTSLARWPIRETPPLVIKKKKWTSSYDNARAGDQRFVATFCRRVGFEN
ncbi:hypothetical protein HDZ31DRAFT_59711 [Schizophyllum fasciatum]